MGVEEADTMEVEAAVMMGVEEVEAEVIAVVAVEAVINQACCP